MKFKRVILMFIVLVMAFTSLSVEAFASTKTSSSTTSKTTTTTTKPKLRRPVSPQQPMWIVHIDTWNYADPAKIIDLIPEDVLPFVVFNISMSINYDHDTHTWGMVNDGYELAKSWLRTCAEKNVWAMIQPASGGQCHFPDYPKQSLKGTLFEEFFRDYPNFLGFNYCEQFWGFEQKDFPITPINRYRHFANLLELTHEYGGYLVVSWCGNEWGQSLNPIAMLKRVADFEKACRNYSENYILCEKYTQHGYIQDAESLCLGAYLSGYSGQYGIRYDSTGWSNAKGEGNKDFTLATGISTHLEKLMQAGLTVIDGPELIWQECFNESWNGVKTSDGYTSRTWSMTDQFQNIMIDMFRKIIDGSIRIPSREEVIKNTKVVIVQDIKNGNDDTKYCSPSSLFSGLYQMTGDGSLRNNRNFFKKTGRYPAIPVVYGLVDKTAKQFEVVVKSSEYNSRWGDETKKVNEFNKLFAKEYTGNLYARRIENDWTVYNPFKENKSASGKLDLKYNTCTNLELSLSQYCGGIVNEFSDSIKIYLNNYDNVLVKSSTLKQDVIKIYGASSEPTVTTKDRGVKQTKSQVTKSWKNGVWTLTVKHNGPIDIDIKCSGTAKNKLTKYTESKVTAPARPPIYTGIRQYEAEHFEYKNVSNVVKNGCRTGVDKFTGQGYIVFGKSSGIAVKDTVSVLESGKYILGVRYLLEKSNVNGVDIYVNGKKVKSATLKKTGSKSSWSNYRIYVNLNKGENTIEIKSSASLTDTLYLDNITIEKAK